MLSFSGFEYFGYFRGVKMKRTLLLLLFGMVIASCSNKIREENKIDITQVDSIVLFAHFPDDTIAPPPRRLVVIRAKQFIEDWNNAVSDGPCIYLANYAITVYKKDKTIREFRANGKHIKEITDECFEIGAHDYFDKLWDNTEIVK